MVGHVPLEDGIGVQIPDSQHRLFSLKCYNSIMSQETNKSVPKKIPTALLFAALSLFVSTLLQIFRLELLDTLIFFVFFLELLAVCFLFFSLLLSINYIYKN